MSRKFKYTSWVLLAVLLVGLSAGCGDDSDTVTGGGTQGDPCNGQDPDDPGSCDQVQVIFTHVPDVEAGDSVVVLQVVFVVDETIFGASCGLGWDFDHLEMDSAMWSTEAIAAFDQFRYEWANDNLDSTNSRKLFQTTGLTLLSGGLLQSATICTYYGHVTRWEHGDSIRIFRNPFVATLFVDDSITEFAPIWPGDPVISTVSGTDHGNIRDGFWLSQNYPNPFSPETRIEFSLPQRSFVTIDVFNVLGARVGRLVYG